MLGFHAQAFGSVPVQLQKGQKERRGERETEGKGRRGEDIGEDGRGEEERRMEIKKGGGEGGEIDGRVGVCQKGQGLWHTSPQLQACNRSLSPLPLKHRLLQLLLTVVLKVPPMSSSPIPPSPSTLRKGSPHLDITYTTTPPTAAHQVAVGLSTSYPTEAKQGCPYRGTGSTLLLILDHLKFYV